ncbi:hypothetical protein HX866_26035 [Pseudomonas gingeri]|uniref:MATE family efflux transporter n=1 Tax=Pseudomonas gingeri TaxID=117681 RepID=UPI0015A4CCD3|nr:MATE family efflux transporter [Pseudomonas gingeri]NWA28358.1 hypothetical protein [Pseudomonas gingeri]
MTSISESAVPIGAPLLNPRLDAMLRGSVPQTLFRLAAPNTLVMCAQAATSLIQTWFLAKLSTDVLAGVGVVIPLLMLMQNMSQGAMGGGISSAVARALGTGSPTHANDLVRHALAINILLGLIFSGSIWFFSPYLYPLLEASGPSLTAALEYSDVTCIGIALLWVMNACASVIRGTGNMRVPGCVILGGFIILIPMTPCLIFGYGPVSVLGVAGAAWAQAIYYLIGTTLLGWFCFSGKSIVNFTAGKLRWQPIKNILAVGAVACVNAFLTNTIIAVTGAIVGAYAGTAVLAGYATSARVEF